MMAMHRGASLMTINPILRKFRQRNSLGWVVWRLGDPKFEVDVLGCRIYLQPVYQATDRPLLEFYYYR